MLDEKLTVRWGRKPNEQVVVPTLRLLSPQEITERAEREAKVREIKHMLDLALYNALLPIRKAFGLVRD